MGSRPKERWRTAKKTVGGDRDVLRSEGNGIRGGVVRKRA